MWPKPGSNLRSKMNSVNWTEICFVLLMCYLHMLRNVRHLILTLFLVKTFFFFFLLRFVSVLYHIAFNISFTNPAGDWVEGMQPPSSPAKHFFGQPLIFWGSSSGQKWKMFVLVFIEGKILHSFRPARHSDRSPFFTNYSVGRVGQSNLELSTT